MITLTIKTSFRTQFLDITRQISQIISDSGIAEGTAIIYVPHTTAGVTINEAADPSVVYDMNKKLSELIPVEKSYRHAEGNSDAHIKASLMGSAAHVIIGDAKPVLGVWQGIFFCEFDGPRTRNVLIQLISG
ncbi:MAG: secondary thiamine-phosphate synthase enzyme YjbQ [Pseudomonadota bacterium]